MLIFCASSVLAPVLITLITLQVALVLESPVPVLKQYAFVCPFQDGQFHNLSFLSQIVVNCAFLCANFLVNMLLPTVLVLFSLLFATMFDKSNFCHYQKSFQSSLSWLHLLLKIQFLQTRFFVRLGWLGYSVKWLAASQAGA